MKKQTIVTLVVVSSIVLLFSGGSPALAECPSADLSGDVILPDLKIFASHWLEGTSP